ncbi:hypothetical protein Holit_00332 [Hollandina sp. SP2]
MAQETDKQIKETNRQIKETNKKIGALGGRLGEIVEYISSPHLEEKFKRFGIFLDTFIDDHIERMKKLRAYADRHNDQRKYLGAIAGLVVSGSVKGYAFKQGFPVLVPSGERMELECPSGFVPKEW